MSMTALRRQAILRSLTATLLGFTRALVIIGTCYVILYPIIVMLSTSFMDPARDLYDMTVRWVPRNFTVDNFRPVASVMNYGRAFLTTSALSLLVASLNVFSCMLVGYGFARFRFRGSGLLFALVILTLVIPPQTIMIPLYLHFRFFDVLGLARLLGHPEGINLLNTPWPFVLLSSLGMGMRSGLYILVFRQFFKNMNKEIEEAAWVDGAGPFRTFFSVMAPNATPAITTVFLFSFVWQWNDDFYSTIFMEEIATLPRALQSLAPTLKVMMGETMKLDPYYESLLNNAGSLLVIAPLLGLYLVAQKAFVQSVERTGLVG
jgi:multiple sugar transport system permease protein